MRKHRFMIELINKEDALDACSAQVWEGEAFADIKNIKPVLTIPENPTNGDMVKAMFSVVGFTPLVLHMSDRKDGFHVHIEDCFKDDFRLTVSKDWWNAPYNSESEDNNDD